jgi:hypothetical protein
MIWKLQRIAAAAVLLFLASSVQAAETAGNVPALQQAGKSDICTAVKKTIADGVDDKVVVSTAILLGHKACEVVRCAVEGGGDLEQIMAGAVACGAPSEIISRCAVDAGAEAAQVAAVLSLPEMQLNLCYFQPEGAPETAVDLSLPVTDPLPSAERGNDVISPYMFP